MSTTTPEAPVDLPRVVLDTNILLRMLTHPGGVSARLRPLLVGRAFKLVTSEPLLAELADVLERPRIARRVSKLRRALALSLARKVAIVVPGTLVVDLVPTDPKDNKVVACALEGDAEFLVTDHRKDLLPLDVIHQEGHRPLCVVSVPTFLRLLRK